ncbi:hypothetical protein K439DRAFT_811646 [Ramaria rubella]|nr:hypothetical protein K439DRAFT_811646 [Ramaria rubella]
MTGEHTSTAPHCTSLSSLSLHIFALYRLYECAAYIHSIHTYLPTYLHTYILTYIHTSTRIHRHAHVHSTAPPTIPMYRTSHVPARVL